MRAVPVALEQYRRTMEADLAAGLPPARRQVLAVAEQAGRVADTFFTGLAASGPDSLRTDLDAAAAAASEAFRTFGGYLGETVAPAARERDAVGRDVYAVASRYFLGAAVDLDETYEWGVAELARIETELAAVAQDIVPGGSVDDAVAALDADPARRIVGTDGLQEWMQKLSDRTVEAMSGVHFDIPEPIRRLECRIAPTKEGASTTPAPATTSAGRAACGGPCPRASRSSRPGARPRRCSTRACRATTCRSRRSCTGARCSTAGSGCCAGCPATARGGRCTPSG